MVRKIINIDYYKDLLKLRDKFNKKEDEPIKKLDNKILFYEEKKRLMSSYKMTFKSSFARTISKKAKLMSLRRKKVIKYKQKDREILSNEEKQFILNEKKRVNRKVFHYSSRTILYLILLTYLVITLYPFLWSVFSSFKPIEEISNGSFNPFPNKWTTENYRSLFGMDSGMINSWILNSFLVAFFGTLGNIILNTFAGYALARIKMPGRNKIMWTLIALMMVPGQVGLIPNYILLKQFGMTNTLSALIVPALVSISFIFMSRQFFINFPKEVEEASRVDGQSRIRFIFRTVMPLMKPMLMTQAVFSFMGFWNNFMIAKMYIDTPENYTLTVGIQSLLERDAHKINYGQILAGSSISIFPILLLYTILNTAFMQSNRTDGDK